jgi:NAD(P)-dependent dehydrogenase (short-subunit alcohol dehydrogenase family)
MTTTIVTGATGGIGSAVVGRFRERGDEVIAIGRDADKVKALDARPAIVDLAHPEGIAAALEPALPDEVDVLVHCAGTMSATAIGDTTVAAWLDQLTVNLVAAAEVTRCALPALRRARGHVVFVNFWEGHGVQPGWGPYAASKYGLRALADALRAEEERHGVGVTSIYPACTATEMQRALREQNKRRYRPEFYIQPATVAGLILQATSAPPDARVTELTVTMPSPTAAAR